MTLYMPLFRSCKTLRSLTQLHGHLIVTGLHKDRQASTKLIDAYSQTSHLHSSKLVFQTFTKPDSFMWGVFIKCCVQNEFFQEAVLMYNKLVMRQRGEITSFVYPSVLRACAGIEDLSVGRKVHGDVVKRGFDCDSFIETSLLYMYGELGCLGDARKVFDRMSVRDVVSWSSIISSYIENREVLEGLDIFRRMVLEDVEVDSVMMLSVAEACAELGSWRVARSVHGHVLRNDIGIDGPLGSSFIVMYSKCGDLYGAERIFESVTCRNTSLWTAMISCYNLNNRFLEALRCCIKMQESNIEPNAVTMMSILNSCAKLGWLKEGKSIHGLLVRRGIDDELEFLGPLITELYSECGKLGYCEKILRTFGKKNIVSWNMVISSCAHKGFSTKAIVFFRRMHKQGLLPDSFSLASSLSACGNVGLIQLGHQIHSHIVKRGFVDEFVQNSLIDMYSKCGFVNSAYIIFDEVQQKSVVTWNSMICGFSQNGNSAEAVKLFDHMYLNCLWMNDVTFLSLVQACSNLGSLERCRWVHHKLITFGVRKDLYIDTALIDMYAKCGDLQTAQEVFNKMSERSVVSWSAMIAAYGRHGQLNAAISLFTKMVESGIKPNEITFMNILSTCSHTGSLEKGKQYFKKMKDYGIEPNPEHLACMVDLLSRAGDLNGAYEMINSMPFQVHASIWGALVNGCRIHQRLDMINSIQERLCDVRTNDTGYYTLLSNIHAEGGNWDEFQKVRAKMRNIGLAKVPGYSTIEVGRERQ